MSPSNVEINQALKTRKCPRCGAKLFYLDVLNEEGGGISTEFVELYDIYGHSFSISVDSIKDFIAGEGKAA